MSRFISGGTIGPSSEPTDGEEPAPLATTKTRAEWEAVQEELERKRADDKARLAKGDEKSLYDVLQANKAAKQAAFEEQHKLKNQFRALDEAEIEFLDDVLARRRDEEDKVRRETEEGLRKFREKQVRDSVVDEEKREEWAMGRKRKRGGKEKEPLVRKKVDGGKEDEGGAKGGVGVKKSVLVSYGSDESDDE